MLLNGVSPYTMCNDVKSPSVIMGKSNSPIGSTGIGYAELKVATSFPLHLKLLAMTLEITEVAAEDGCHNPVEEYVDLIAESDELSDISAAPK